ncbi:MAG: GNAT family N-acetyltransferase [Ktedonobacterales bacterium]
MTVIAVPRVELATTADLEALMRLRVEQGWHRSDALLHAILGWEHGRLFIIREAALDPTSVTPDAPIVATSAIAAGPTGVIGNVIVRADYRRRGLGRVIMQAALDWLRDAGVRSVLLDATVDGRPLYTRLGFVGDKTSWFAHAPITELNRTLLVTRSGSIHAATSGIPIGDVLGRLASLDAAAFGGDRLGLLALLLRRPTSWLYIAEDASGAPTGYAMLSLVESPDRGVHLGPWVAAGYHSAAALLAAILREDAPWRPLLGDAAETGAELFFSLPGTNRHALDLISDAGGHLVEDDLIMQLDFDVSGKPTPATEPRRHVATRPDWLYGWLAPMVF